MKPKIVVTRQMTDSVMERIDREFDAILPGPSGALSAEEALAALESHGAEGFLFNSGAPLTPEYVARLPAGLKVAATLSVGFEHVNIDAIRDRGLTVTNTPGVLDDSVAEFTLLLMLGAARRMPEYGKVMADGWGRYFAPAEMLGMELTGKRLGIVGMGNIGRAVARRARAFGMEIHYHNRNRLAAGMEEGAVYHDSLESMLPAVDVVSVNAPATAETKNILDARTIGLMRQGVVVVNTSRGALIDEAALLDALKSGHVRAAGLDVFAGEPKPNPELIGLPTVFAAPHMASATDETRSAMGNLCLDNIAAVLSGKPPLTPI